eukprot:s99_g36.t1
MSAQGWCNAITLTAQLSTRTRQQRYGAFAPVRMPAAPKEGDRHLLRQCFSRYLINGNAIFRSVAEAILLARHEIFILSFFLSPHIELVRDGRPLPNVSDSKVSTLLKFAADRGVRVYVLLYHETMNFVPNDSEYAEAEISEDLVEMVEIPRKVVVVDQQLAIVGGLDLCIGRYDDWQHRITDPTAATWQGQDYYNPRIKDVTEGRLQKDLLQRVDQPRLPWQDIACELLGRPARDVARHCVERWNHARFINSIYDHFPLAMLRRKVAVSNEQMLLLPRESYQKQWPQWPPEKGPWQDGMGHPCWVLQESRAQVVRSVGRWSAGTKTESSTHQAYCDLIQDSKHFIYIENQFFCSGLEGDSQIGNRVLEALFRRIVKAHEQRDGRFHVVIVLPLLPALEGPLCQANASLPVFRVMHAQYCTLRGLRSQLRARDIDETKYISIFGLRTYGFLPNLGPATEQIYIHSKAMVVDDEVALVGSSNINDRSLLGMRDSEVNLVIQDDVLGSTAASSFGGFRGGTAANLRKALFVQHLGLEKEKLDEGFDNLKKDWERLEWKSGALPSDKVQTWQQLAACQRQVTLNADFTKIPSEDHAKEVLREVQGYLVEFPLEFLQQEDLAPSVMGGLLGPEESFNSLIIAAAPDGGRHLTEVDMDRGLSKEQVLDLYTNAQRQRQLGFVLDIRKDWRSWGSLLAVSSVLRRWQDHAHVFSKAKDTEESKQVQEPTKTSLAVD